MEVYDPNNSMYSPERYIELSQIRRAEICTKLRDLRMEYDSLLADEVRVRIEVIRSNNEQ